jgi:hypothetical protein
MCITSNLNSCSFSITVLICARYHCFEIDLYLSPFVLKILLFFAYCVRMEPGEELRCKTDNITADTYQVRLQDLAEKAVEAKAAFLRKHFRDSDLQVSCKCPVLGSF